MTFLTPISPKSLSKSSRPSASSPTPFQMDEISGRVFAEGLAELLKEKAEAWWKEGNRFVSEMISSERKHMLAMKPSPPQV
jgi:hypothetical protein